MMSTRLSSAVGLVLLASACCVTGGCQASSPPAQPSYAPGYGPYPPGYAPAPQGYAPQAGYAPQGGYAPGPQPGYAPGAAPQQVAPGSSTFAGALNVSALQSLASRNPKACGLLQVAPGVFARIDCQAYSPSTRAVAHLSPRKALALTNHTTQWQPLQFFGLRIQQGLAQGFSKGIFQRPVNGTQQGVAGASNAPVIVADAVPGTVDHRAQNLEGPIKDQGPVGACTAFSLSTTIDNAAIRAGKMQAGSGSQASSPNHVWSGYGFPQMGAAADATLNRPLSTLAVWGASFSEECKISTPDDDCGSAVSPPVVPGTFRTDPLIQAKMRTADASPVYRVVGFDKLDTQPVQIDQLTQTLASGADLWVALRIDGFAWSKVKKDGIIPDWNAPNGGHAVTLAGYRQTANGKQFLVHNNWGTSWGEGGYAWLSEAMVQQWMNFAYKVRIDGGVPPANLTDDDCGADEMVDVAKGTCAPICPDNSRPNNGCGGAPGAPAAPAVPGFPGFPTIPGFNIQNLPTIPGLPNFGR
ncbi:MAG: hypothetical protein QOI41_7794 [Myxococcales bacterium]|nr:hypothetical protein [Myxococcales bacterium]